MVGKIIELRMIAINQNRLKISKKQPLYKTSEVIEKVLRKKQNFSLQQISYITHQRDRKDNKEMLTKFLCCFLNLI